MNKIIAIVGMCGSGKSVVSEFLEGIGYKKIYFGGVTMDKLKEDGLEITPENEKMMREKLRKKFGMAAFAKILLPKILECSKQNNTVLDGLYSWDELKFLKKELNQNLIVIALVVDKDIRYSRLINRDIRPLNFEQAKNRDISEIENLAKSGPIVYADYFINNNGTRENVESRLKEILLELK